MKLTSTLLLLASLLILSSCDSQRTIPKNTEPSAKPKETGLWPPMRLVEAGWKASWSPDGTRLVYGTPMRDAIEILDLRTLKRIAIIALGKDPDWSPDGRHIAFVREPGYDAYQAEAVWLCTPDNPKPRRMLTGGFPAWSADGKTLYVHERTKNQLLAVRVDDPDFKPTVFFDQPRSWYPAVSPDGKQIAFGAREQLEIVDRATGQIIFAWPTPGHRGLLPAWSPDGKLIAFGGFDDSTLGIRVLDVAAKKAAPVLEGHYTMPAWSKDGSRLAFDRRLFDQREVWVVSRSWVDARLSDPAHAITAAQQNVRNPSTSR